MKTFGGQGGSCNQYIAPGARKARAAIVSSTLEIIAMGETSLDISINL